jgi:L-aspartate oxidase
VQPTAGGTGVVEAAQLAERRQALRELMWNEVGIVRSVQSLQLAIAEAGRMAKEIEILYEGMALDAELVQLRNLATVAELIVGSAGMRLESRGGHYNSDHPERDDANWQRPTLLVGH